MTLSRGCQSDGECKTIQDLKKLVRTIWGYGLPWGRNQKEYVTKTKVIIRMDSIPEMFYKLLLLPRSSTTLNGN